MFLNSILLENVAVNKIKGYILSLILLNMMLLMLLM